MSDAPKPLTGDELQAMLDRSPFIAFLGLAVLLGVGVMMNSGKDTSAIPSPLVGKMAPDFALPVLDEPGRIVTRDDLLGEPYLLNVWGSWCPACRDEHPVITELAESGRVRVIGYDYKDEADDARRWLQQFGNAVTSSAVTLIMNAAHK